MSNNTENTIDAIPIILTNVCKDLDELKRKFEAHQLSHLKEMSDSNALHTQISDASIQLIKDSDKLRESVKNTRRSLESVDELKGKLTDLSRQVRLLSKRQDELEKYVSEFLSIDIAEE